MNIVNKLTLRQLKLNKRRTLVTILGAIISVAMVTAVSVSALSGIDLMRRIVISADGNWHMRYHDLAAEHIEAVERDENIDQTMINYPVGYVQLEHPKNSNKPYLFVRAYNTEGFELLPIELVSGQLPKNSHEIVIPEHLASSTGLEYQIGDKITLQIGQRYEAVDDTDSATDENQILDTEHRTELNQGYGLIRNEQGEIGEAFVPEETREYTVVGMIKKSKEEQSWSPGYELITYTSQDEIPDEAKVVVSVLLKDLKKNIYEHNATLGLELGVNVVEPHTNLLVCYGVNSNTGMMNALFGIFTIVMLIIIMGSVSLINNAFAISIAERTQYLGMLASIGATRKQKRASVFFEGFVIGSISIPLGLLAGILGMGVTFRLINNMLQDVLSVQEDLHLIVSPGVIVVTVLISMLTIFISTYIPAKRASRISPIEAIKQSADIRINKKEIKTSRLTRKIFGFEGELALKNLKRNGRRYRATLLSLIVSIVLFLSTATFSGYMGQSIESMMQSANYDIRVTTHNMTEEEAHKVLEEIKGLDNIETYNLISTSYLQAYLPDEMTPDFIKDMVGADEREEGEYFARVAAMEDEVFNTYVKSIGADMRYFNDINKPAAILLNRIIFKDKNKVQRDEDIVIVKTGEKISLSEIEWNEEANAIRIIDVAQVAIGGIVKEPPLGISIPDGNMIQLILPKTMYSKLLENASEKLGHKVSSHESIYLTSKDPFGLQQEIEALQGDNEVNVYDIYNIYEQKQSMQQMQTVMKVFIYGFIVLITMISIANIFNTISTSIALRKREFSMLRSVGMTQKGFNKMINFESIFYGLKALVYGIPISFVIMVIMYESISSDVGVKFLMPVKSILIVVISVFAIVGASMFYAGAKIKDDSIIEGLKDTNL